MEPLKTYLIEQNFFIKSHKSTTVHEKKGFNTHMAVFEWYTSNDLTIICVSKKF